MQFKVAVIFTFALSAMAMPTEVLNKREAQVDGHLFVCTDANFSGQCANIGFFVNVCNNLPSGFNDNISSFGPDAGWECTTYTDPNCTGATYAGHKPGFGTLPSFINDEITSFRCGPL